MAVLLASAAFASCASRAPEGGGDPASPVVARFGSDAITVADVDARILALTPADRPAPGADMDAWYLEQIREVALERALIAEAEASDLDEDAAFVAARQVAEKQVAVRLCLGELRPSEGEIGEAELRAEYDAQVESFVAPERRFVYHLFLRYREPAPSGVDPTAERRARRTEIEGLRDRVLRGERFSRLAAEYSDSESRHRDGALEWITPGMLPAGFEEVVFALESGVPSEPVETRDGMHLFYVDQILPQRQSTFEEVARSILTRLQARRGEAALVEIESEIEVPDGSLVLDRDAFDELAEEGDDAAIVLALGDVTMTLGDVRREVRRSVAQQPGSRSVASRELAWQVLQHHRRRELIYGHCRASGAIPQEELVERLASWRERALLDLSRQRRLVETAQRDLDRLELFYRGEIGSFSRPPRWHVRRLQIPIDESAPEVMRELEQAAAVGSDGKIDLDQLQVSLGGEIEDLGLRELAELARLAPRLPPLIAPVEVGGLSAPYRSDDALEIAEVVERRDPEPLPFEEVQDRVAVAYVAQYTREVYRELSEEIFERTELEILPGAVEALREASSAPDEVSVEELEALLDEPFDEP